MKKLFMALSLTAAFGLMACGDDSSSSAKSGDGKVEKCEVTRDGDNVLVKLVADGITMNTTLSIDAEGVITEVAKLEGDFSQADFDKECAEQKADQGNLSVECDASNNTISGTYKDETVANADELEAQHKIMCDMVLDPEGFAKELEESLDQLEAAEEE